MRQVDNGGTAYTEILGDSFDKKPLGIRKIKTPPTA